MPFGDGTGPEGFGPRTGRGLGRCGGYRTPGYTKGFGRGGFGRGAGYGRGFGMGRRGGFGFWNRGWNWFRGWWNNGNNDPQSVSEKDYLQDQKKLLEEELNAINDRLKDLEGSE